MLIFTASEEAGPAEFAGNVDIVGREIERSGSRIIRAISHAEGSQLLGTAELAESPWLARARSNLQIMYRTALAVSHTLDIDQLLQRILELIFEWVEADRGCMMLIDPAMDELVPKVSRHRRPAGGDSDKLEISRTILDYVREHREGVLTSDAREDQRWDPAASIVRTGVREAICVPMQGRYGMVGVIYIDTYTPPGRQISVVPNKFSEEHLKLMIAIAHQAALAIEDTSYYSAMVQAERLAAMGQTIATLSHHIKNILQGIRGGSYLIEEGLKNQDFDVVRKGWDIVERNQEKISHLVMDMLTFSKEREPELAAARINAVARDVLELMAIRADETGVALQSELDESIPELMFDAEMMHRAILNVVTNAIDACEKHPQGRVIVRTGLDAAGQEVQVVIEDNGEGISHEDLKRVFSVFESRKGSRGTGLGLPVSQKILREHGGEIQVSSTPGAGSRFVLTFPAVTVAAGDGETMANKKSV
jgi:signal transduction histidine kinase